mmetsp:Transcript_38377/g.70069  ORF Transcript_38377/g.70069 Transcript_38377/m.70069 type:complete len:484 (-) Transcript_38377:156-1607(-)
MEFNAPYLLIGEHTEPRGTRADRWTTKVLAVVALVVIGLWATVSLVSQPPVRKMQQPPAGEMLVVDHPQQRHVPIKEAQMLKSSLAQATTVYNFNKLLKTNFVSDSVMGFDVFSEMQLKTLFDDFLATMGTRVPHGLHSSKSMLGAQRHNYSTVAEYNHRLFIFSSNILTIMKLNEIEYAQHPDDHRARFAITVHTDWTLDEFKSIRLTLKAQTFPETVKFRSGQSQTEEENASSITCSRVTSGPVRDQGGCGSCWAFATIEQLRYAFFYKYRRDSGKLSAQYLMDCMPPAETSCYAGLYVPMVGGCCGGLPNLADKWLEESGGLPTTQDYGPYLSGDMPFRPFACRANVTKAVKPVGGVTQLRTETEIANAFCNSGSVSIGVAADQLMYYAGGILDGSSCPASWPNHAVVVVGIDRSYYDSPVHIVQNSWGTNWGVSPTRPYETTEHGENGHMLFRFGSNACNMTSMSTVLNDVQPAPDTQV